MPAPLPEPLVHSKPSGQAPAAHGSVQTRPPGPSAQSPESQSAPAAQVAPMPVGAKRRRDAAGVEADLAGAVSVGGAAQARDVLVQERPLGVGARVSAELGAVGVAERGDADQHELAADLRERGAAGVAAALALAGGLRVAEQVGVGQPVRRARRRLESR